MEATIETAPSHGTVPQEIVEMLGKCLKTGRNLYLPGRLPIEFSERMIKVCRAVGGEWDSAAKAIVFETDAEDALDCVFQWGEAIRPRPDGETLYFSTPLNLARRMVNLGGVQTASTDTPIKVLEPSAGEGALAIEAASYGVEVHAIEIRPEAIAKLKAQLKNRHAVDILEGDFLEYEPAPVYDVVLMNPPFARQADIRHVNHAWQFVVPGGTLVAIVSACVRYRENPLTREFRKWLSYFASIEDLPDDTFYDGTTRVRTCLIRARKPNA